MFPKTVQDPEYPSSRGARKDGQDLVVEWMKNKKVNSFIQYFSQTYSIFRQ